MDKKMGMLANIYKSPLGDGTLNGLSSKHNTCLIVGDNVTPIFEESDRMPTFKLVIRFIGGRLYKHIEPLESGSWAMGGNFAFSSDGRFPNDYPLPIHDRDMSKERR